MRIILKSRLNFLHPTSLINERVHFYAFLVQITAFFHIFNFETAPHWSQNFTSGSLLCSDLFSSFFRMKYIKHTNLLKTYAGSLCFKKVVSKRPTTQISMEDHPDMMLKPSNVVWTAITRLLLSNYFLIYQLWLTVYPVEHPKRCREGIKFQYSRPKYPPWETPKVAE